MNGLWLILILLLATFIFEIPFIYSFMAIAIYYIVGYAGVSLGTVVNRSVGLIFSSYVIMAVPLFIFTANIMKHGKITHHMFQFSKALCGRAKGAMGYVNIINSMIFSGMTGSAIADVAGPGKMEMEAMIDDGYDPPYAGSLTACTAIIGPIFPPSMPFVVYSLITGASVGAMFLGGVIPAILIALVLIVYNFIASQKNNYPRGIEGTFREFLATSFHAIPALFTPVVLLGGIYTGVFTPTEAAAVAAVYAILISVLVYRIIGLKDFLVILRDTVIDTGKVCTLSASSILLCFCVSHLGIGEMVAKLIGSFTGNATVTHLLVAFVFLVAGCFLDQGILQWVFVPIAVPVLTAAGVNLVHFGITSALCMMIGLATPPMGTLLFLVSGIGKIPFKDLAKKAFPMAISIAVVVVLIICFPDLVLWLPSISGG